MSGRKHPDGAPSLSARESHLRCSTRLAVRRGLLFVIALLIGAVCFDSAPAQITSASIIGGVSDTSGASIANAVVSVKNEATGATYGAITDKQGSYVVPLLPVNGSYQVQITLAGFTTFVQKGIVLQLNQNARVDATLKVGSATQQVVVTEQPPQIETASSTIGKVIDSRELTELPMNGRNPIQLISLTTGITNISVPDVLYWRGGSYWSSNGARSNENTVLLDGAIYAGNYNNNVPNLPAPDTLQEFRIVTSNYDAELGRSPGSVLNAIVKSGTNSFHGGAWEFLRNDALIARNYFEDPKQKKAILKQNQFGAAGGGPILRNRWFWYASYQGLRRHQESLSTAFAYTDEMRQGRFPFAIRDPNTGKLYPQNAAGEYVIPQSEFDPVAIKVLNDYIPQSTAPNGEVQQKGLVPTNDNQIMIKSDFRIAHNNTFNFMWLRDRTDEGNPFTYSSFLNYAPQSPYNLTNVYVLNDVHTFSPSLLNELRGAYTKVFDDLSCKTQPGATELGVQNFHSQGPIQLPDFNVAGYFTLASSGLCNLMEGAPTREISDTFTWVRGNHQFKFGADWYRNQDYTSANYLNPGDFTFDGSSTGSALSDFLIGKVSLYQRNTGGASHLHEVEWSGFAQDDWKINRNLTLNLGLRYFVQQPWVADLGGPSGTVKDGVGTFVPGYKSSRWPNIPEGILFPGDKGPDGIIPRGLYKTPLSDFEPRIGLAFDPGGDGKTAIRSSFGVFHDIVIVDAVAQAGGNQPYLYSDRISHPAGGLSNPYLGQPNPWPYLVYNNPTPPFVLPLNGGSLDRNTRNPTVYSYALDIQRQVGSYFMIDVGYVGKVSRKLIMLNQADPAVYIPGNGPNGTPLSSNDNNNINSRRLFAPTYASIPQVGSYGSGSYNSLQFSTEYRTHHGLSFTTAYTWSKNLDTNSNWNVASSFQEQDPFCLSCEWGPSDNDLPNVFTFSLVYNVPTPFQGVNGFGAGVGRAVLGNWEISDVTHINSGYPFTCYSGTANMENGIGHDRCNVVGKWKLSDTRSTAAKSNQFFRQSAFTPNAIGQPGNSSRNMLRGDRQRNTQFAVLRNFPLEKYGSFQFRAEFFNLFNQVTLGNPTSYLTSAQFGQTFYATPAREIQFGLKYSF